MSINSIFKSTLVVSACVAGLTLSACASNGTGGSRYGSVYDYESGGGGGCNAAPTCGAVIAQPAPAPAPASVYVQQQAPVYTTPAPAPAPVQTYSGPVDCPTGTTPNGDGTCMMNETSYTDTTTTTTSSTVYSGSSSSQMADCPAGTISNGDGTCMMSSGASTSQNVTIYENHDTGYQAPVDYVPPVYQPIRK